MDYEEKLKAIINSDKTPFVDIDTFLKYFPELKESKDEIIREEIIDFLRLPHPQFVGKRNHEEWIDWLEKQGEQKPAKWSEEDAMQLDAAIHIVANSGHTCTSDWLKVLKERVQLQNGYNPYKEVVESIAEMCKHYDKISHSSLRDFYDNVKVKCKDAKEYDSLYLQNTWKPSGPQIECLSDAIKHYNSQGYTAPVLKELLEQLKKIREE